MMKNKELIEYTFAVVAITICSMLALAAAFHASAPWYIVPFALLFTIPHVVGAYHFWKGLLDV